MPIVFNVFLHMTMFLFWSSFADVCKIPKVVVLRFSLNKKLCERTNEKNGPVYKRRGQICRGGGGGRGEGGRGGGG